MKYHPSKPRRLRSRICAALAALLAPSGLRAQVPDSPPVAKADPVVARLVEAHNRERTKAGLPPLILEARLEEAARAHARDMADRDVMSHEGGDGSTPSQRVVRAGYHYASTGENVARGYRDVATVMQSWMDSPPHKKNVLGDFTEIGVARVEAGDGVPYWCADFGKPLPKFDPATASADLIGRINAERVAAKLPGLSEDPKLTRAARSVAGDLASKKGQGVPPSRIEGIDESRYEEIASFFATGNPDAESVVKMFVESPDYKARILGKYAKAGIGYATAEDGTPHWCLIFANPARK